MDPLRARTELACVHVLDHALAQRADCNRTHWQLLSWMRLRHLDPQDRPPRPLSTISILVTAPRIRPPLQRAIAQRFSALARPRSHPGPPASPVTGVLLPRQPVT